MVPSLTQIVNSAAPTSVSVADIVALEGGSLDSGYLPGVYMFSPGVERTLKALVGSDGLPVFPEMRTSKVLCGYGYVLNVDLPATFTANAKAIIFGNFKLGVTVREVIPLLLISNQRYAEYRMLYAALRHNQDCQVVDPAALQVLQQHS